MTCRTVAKDIFLSVLSDMGAMPSAASFSDKAMVKLSIDSRTIAPGDVFIAIRGGINDGHDHIADAQAKGASSVVAENAYRHKASFSHNSAISWVDNSLRFFWALAHRHLKSCGAIRIAITGSNGKTTTKEMLRSALVKICGDEQVYASFKNLNNHFGVPLNALAVTPQHRYAIFELGMNHLGEIADLCRLVAPHVGVITNIGHAHEGNFLNGIDGVQQAKGELFKYLAETGGRAAVNLDDERAREEGQHVHQRCTFGASKDADIRLIEHSDFSPAGLQMVSAMAAGELIRFSIPLPGYHNAINASGALAVVKCLDLPLAVAAEGIRDVALSIGRMNVHKTSLGYVVINDGYNANPGSMAAGIRASLGFSAIRRVAVIGAMAELGDKSARHHHELGRSLAKHFAHLFICGDPAKFIVEGAMVEGMSEGCITFAESAVDLIGSLKAFVQAGDVIFVKGSHSYNMQAVADALIEV